MDLSRKTCLSQGLEKPCWDWPLWLLPSEFSVFFFFDDCWNFQMACVKSFQMWPAVPGGM